MTEFSTSKLGLFPEKISSIAEAKNHNALDLSYPISVELSLLDKCNLNCIWCSDRRLRGRLMGYANIAIIKKVISDLQNGGTRGIVFEGGGEPTLWKNFNDIIMFNKSLGLAAGLITNGTRRLVEEIVDCLEWVRISLDVATSEQMKKLKGKDLFAETLGNIEHIGRIKKNTSLGISYIITKYNQNGMGDLIKKLQDFGADYIQIKPVVDHPELKEENIEPVLNLQNYQQNGFKIFTEAMHDNDLGGNNNEGCYAHSLSPVIASNGDVYICGRLNQNPSWKPLGNINEQSFTEIWHGGIRRVQSLIISDPSYCRDNCPPCRMTKFNKILNQKNIHLSGDKIKVQTPHFI